MLGFRQRGLQYDSSEEWVDDDDRWTELDPGDWRDWVHVALTGLYQLVVFMAVLHLWGQRSWPPYCPRQISLVCMTGLAGIVAYLGAMVAAGAIKRHSGDLFAHCGLDAVFHYTTWGVWISVALVRVYRSWKILIKHSVDMWPPWAQVLLLTVPWCIPAVAYTIDDHLSRFNEVRNWCEIYRPIDTFTYILGSSLIAGAFVLVYQMRKVRKQMNEYRLQVFQLAFLFLTGSLVFPLQHLFLDNKHEIRRIWVLYHNFLDSLVLFWPPIAEPMYRYLTGDVDYLNSYTQGFSTLPTPAQMKGSLRDQLSLDELRTEFQKFAENRMARELPDFYQACLDRDEIENFFGRQAATTAIIDRFIRSGSEQELNISDRIRNKILNTEITSYNIFNEAMSVAVTMMDTNFSAAFKRSEAYKQLERNVQDEAEELDRLRKMNQLPPKNHVPTEPKGFVKVFRRFFPPPPSEASLRSSSSRSGGSSVGGREGSTTSSHPSATTECTTRMSMKMMSSHSLLPPESGGNAGEGAAVRGDESDLDV
ncbi:unnamed protein product [Ectocarpus sp. 6 AP-2014]